MIELPRPTRRPRRMRASERNRSLIRETALDVSDFIYPLFVKPGSDLHDEVPSMPGVFQCSVDRLVGEVDELSSLGIGSVMLFGLPDHKDPLGSGAYQHDGIVQQAIAAIKEHDDTYHVITDICLCEYTDHGHCGKLDSSGDVDNDATLELLAKVAVSHAEAGADMVAPSDMMDGRVAALRSALDDTGHPNMPILSYAVKYASAFYGPFRDAADSAPAFGDRSTYQMDPANSDEALREARLDIEEGADMIMVKPALGYLDVLERVVDAFHFPTVAYNVSGEYALVKAAAQRGWVDERRLVLEILCGIKRAGACATITYHAKDAARWLQEGIGA
jgi:porphobilinogen synthase